MIALVDSEEEGTLRPEWLNDEDQRAMSAAVSSGAPPRSLALYARWWQLETWLRDLAYLELRTEMGVGWEKDAVAASGRRTQDAAYSHMTGPDNENPLAYLDYTQLIKAIDSRWELFDRTLIEKKAWDGRQVELAQIRHRIGHVRRPHMDDLSRIEQTLRDLEGGAFLAVSEYNNRWTPPEGDRDNPVADGWLNRAHPDARRLINHADSQYDTTFTLKRSFRPWGGIHGNGINSGQLWHADFFVGGHAVDIPGLWREIDRQPVSKLLVHLTSDGPGQVGFVFSATDDDIAIADAIGAAFDSVLTTSRQIDDISWSRRAELSRMIDFRIKIETAWNIVGRETLPITLFGAGGGLQIRPKVPKRKT